VASAIHLRFDVQLLHCPRRYKDRLLRINDNRITSEGVIVIKAQNTAARGTEPRGSKTAARN
jgi:ribosome-associated protein